MGRFAFQSSSKRAWFKYVCIQDENQLLEDLAPGNFEVTRQSLQGAIRLGTDPQIQSALNLLVTLLVKVFSLPLSDTLCHRPISKFGRDCNSFASLLGNECSIF